MARLRILSDDDFDKLYKIPKLNNEERQFVFESLLGIFPAACGVIWRNEQIYT